MQSDGENYVIVQIKEEISNETVLCRVCLIKNSSYIDIFGEIGRKLTINEKLSMLFQLCVSENDNWPQSICTNCCNKIEDFHTFYTFVKANEYELSNSFGPLREIIQSKADIYELEEIIIPNIDTGQTNEACTTRKIENPLLVSDDLHHKEKIPSNPLVRPRGRSQLCPICDKTLPNKRSMRSHMRKHNLKKPQRKLINVKEIGKENHETENKKLENIQIQINENSTTDESNKDLLNRELRNRIIKEKIVPLRGKLKKELEKILSEKRKKEKKIIPKKEVTILREKEDEELRQCFVMKCEICPEQFKKFADAKIHYRTVHQTRGYITCCSKQFYARHRLVEHMKLHLNPNKFRCEPCQKTFLSANAMNKHMTDTHAPPELRLFKCDKCPKTFARYNRLRVHMYSHMSEAEKTYICPTCEKPFATNSALVGHVRNNHENNDVHICDVCAKIYRSKYTYMKHRIIHMDKKPPKIECTECNAKFDTKPGLKRHMLRHETSIPHNCPHCNKISPNRLAMEAHVKFVHKREKKHICKVCEKSFKRSISLKEHMALHTGDLLYTCSYCPKQFNSNANKYAHQKRKHPVEYEEAKIRKKQ